MYAKGMSQRDIEDSLREIYGAEVPQTLISKITDKILPEVNEWQNRPLESVYPIVYFDGIMFKSRKDNQIINKCVYSILGIDMDGRKDVLGCWISEMRVRVSMPEYALTLRNVEFQTFSSHVTII
jgi:putative transposase